MFSANAPLSTVTTASYAPNDRVSGDGFPEGNGSARDVHGAVRLDGRHGFVPVPEGVVSHRGGAASGEFHDAAERDVRPVGVDVDRVRVVQRRQFRGDDEVEVDVPHFKRIVEIADQDGFPDRKRPELRQGGVLDRERAADRRGIRRQVVIARRLRAGDRDRVDGGAFDIGQAFLDRGRTGGGFRDIEVDDPAVRSQRQLRASGQLQRAADYASFGEVDHRPVRRHEVPYGPARDLQDRLVHVDVFHESAGEDDDFSP